MHIQVILHIEDYKSYLKKIINKNLKHIICYTNLLGNFLLLIIILCTELKQLVKL